MHGTGNDFIVIEDLNENLKGKEEHIAKTLCHRRFGIGADGILLVRESKMVDIKMEIINADGSYAEMCGNGIRCFAKYVHDKKIVNSDTIKIETGDGIKTANLNIQNGEVVGVTINMGFYSLEPKDIPANSKEKIINKQISLNNKEYYITSMKLGVPHTVIVCKIKDTNVKEGKYIEKYDLFSEGTNVNFCEVVDRGVIEVKTWERGAGETLACGTGSCASVVASNLLGHTDKLVKVVVPGGELLIEIKDEGIFMTGPAVNVFSGEVII